MSSEMLCQQCGSVLSAVTFTCVRGEYCKPAGQREQRCADCMKVINPGKPHNCPQQAARNRRKANAK